MLTDEDEKLVCQLVEMRYAAMREANRMTKQAKELSRQAKQLRDGVKHISLDRIGEKFEVNGSRVFSIALRYGVNMSRK